MSENFLESGDSPDLEALFDSIASQNQHWQAPAEPQSSPTAVDAQVEIYAQIGQITRKLHDTLREMGYDKSLSKVADAIPDAKGRLSYIATLTENAAERVLNATDIAGPIQEKLEKDALALGEKWEQVCANQLSVEEFKLLATSTRDYLGSVPLHTRDTNTQLLEIMMAQDFQDLTGQVIKKVMEMVQVLESELLSVLIEHSPPQKKVERTPSLLNGPAINPENRSDVVANQEQVDDLLASLGF